MGSGLVGVLQSFLDVSGRHRGRWPLRSCNLRMLWVEETRLLRILDRLPQMWQVIGKSIEQKLPTAFANSAAIILTGV